MTNIVLNKNTIPDISGIEEIVIGNRIPRDYFECTGVGQSDITIHAGSYHLALRDAGIERFNLMHYSSILPQIARKIDQPENYVHGAVLESIIAVCNTTKGQRASAGIIYGWLYNRKTQEKYGGLVCENNGNYTEVELSKLLKLSLNELYINGFSEQYELKDTNLISRSFIPEKKYGTALVAIGFTNYVYPVIKS